MVFVLALNAEQELSNFRMMLKFTWATITTWACMVFLVSAVMLEHISCASASGFIMIEGNRVGQTLEWVQYPTPHIQRVVSQQASKRQSVSQVQYLDSPDTH